MTHAILIESDVPGATLWRRGKVRDVYEAGGDRLVMVASDRLSAFDVVFPTPIPDKGRVLTQLSNFWFKRLESIVPNHLVATDLKDFPPAFRAAKALEGRAVLVDHCERIDVECVARGYISGSAWVEYKALGTVAGEPLPNGLEESARLADPIFTPATKAMTGHDENISRRQLAAQVGSDLARELEQVTLTLYRAAHAYALGRGLILADTKFEFGFHDGKLTLIDEVLTPDSSRYWDAARYKPGGTPPSYDKQYVRDFVTRSGWNKEPLATLHVRTKPEVRDPQGEAALGALRSLGLDVSKVRTGKEIVVTFDARDEAAAEEAIRTMGNELLANPVIEDYEYDVKEAQPA
ncbi:MAG: phosphoribosylaminoimidazolesuccinocarboxamide synthase [Chloroflexi bacterium]|nr:MAG: phosphoribosylaminoimidazolesuccinocarboxamide synthase [Chloroflexota bacterium]